MRQKDGKIDLFTEETKYVNYSHPLIQEKIRELFTKEMSDVDKAKAAYYFVRDEIKHSFDIGTNVVSVTASECLYNKTGICHVKSNLLTALLRSQNIPTGFCFQHIAWDDTDSNNVPGYVTHGYNAVYLDGKWIKLDARGNKSNVHAEFSLGEPVLAFSINEEIGEYNVNGIFASPNMTSMHYLEGLSALDPGNYTGCNEVFGVPEVMEVVSLDIIAKLTSKDDKYACAIADKIISESQETDEWYEHFDDFAALLDHPKSFVRNRALLILAANVQWDDEKRFDLIISDFLSHVTDEKPITARQCIKALAQIGQAKREYIPLILSALGNADLSKYKDTMRPLIEKDISETERKLTTPNLGGDNCNLTDRKRLR